MENTSLNLRILELLLRMIGFRMSIILTTFQIYGITNWCMYSIKSCVRLFNATRLIFLFSISIEMSYGPRGFEGFNLEMMFSTSLDVKEMFSESLNEFT